MRGSQRPRRGEEQGRESTPTGRWPQVWYRCCKGHTRERGVALPYPGKLRDKTTGRRNKFFLEITERDHAKRLGLGEKVSLLSYACPACSEWQRRRDTVPGPCDVCHAAGRAAPGPSSVALSWSPRPRSI